MGLLKETTMKNVYKSFFGVLALLMTLNTEAQYSYASGGAFSFGVQSFPAADLQGFFPNSPELNSVNFSFGGYGYWQFNKWMFGFKGVGIYGNSVSRDNIKYSAQGGYWSADFGYKVINRDRFGLYPILGIGFGGLTYTIANQTSFNAAGFPPVFNKLDLNWSGAALIDIGVRAEHLFSFKSDGNNKGGGFVGLELGYMMALGEGKWEIDQASAWPESSSPDFGLNGFYARLLVGGMGGKN